MSKLAPSPLDSRARAVVDPLHARSRTQLLAGAVPLLGKLVDIWIPMALPALKLVTSRLRCGALVVCDRVISVSRQYADYLRYVHDPSGPFRSATIPGQGGLEISMKCSDPELS